MECKFLFVDSRYLSESVHNFTGRYAGAYSAAGEPTEPKGWPSKIQQVTAKGKGRKRYRINTHVIKRDLYNALQAQVPGPSYVHFPAQTESSFFDQLTAEVLRTKIVKGRPVQSWVPKGGCPSHWLDCTSNARAALSMFPGRHINDVIDAMESAQKAQQHHAVNPKPRAHEGFLRGIRDDL